MRVALAMVLGVILFAGCGQPAADDPEGTLRDRLDAAMASLAGSRGADGQWPAAQVPYVAEAAAAARLDLHAWPAPVPVADQAAMPASDASFMASLRPLHAVALAAAGDAPTLADVRAHVLDGFDGAQFGEPALLNDDAFALVVLGSAGADEEVWAQVASAVDRLLAAQAGGGGGWSWAVGGQAETDMTGIVLHGLAEAQTLGRVDGEAALSFLATTQAASGGHSLQVGGEANCDSTVWAIRAQALLGQKADEAAWRFLLDLQRPDGGFAYTPDGPANALCTAEAATLLGLALHGEVPAPASAAASG